MDFHLLDEFWDQDVFNEEDFYNIMKYYSEKYEDYIHAYTNYNRFHVIHEMANYFSDRKEECTQYRYVIIEFYVNNVGHIETHDFFPYVGNYLESNNFMPQNFAEEYSILKLRYILN